MPTVLSMCHGGIWRVSTRCAIARTYGRASSYVTRDMGAMLSTRWQDWHFSWKIGAISLVNVGGGAPAAPMAGACATNVIAIPMAPEIANCHRPVENVENFAAISLLCARAAARLTKSGLKPDTTTQPIKNGRRRL